MKPKVLRHFLEAHPLAHLVEEAGGRCTSILKITDTSRDSHGLFMGILDVSCLSYCIVL